jgi:hypothetical protein
MLAPPWGLVGRVYTTPALHVGIRPALYLDNEGERGGLEIGVGMTVQVSAFMMGP